MTLSKRLDAVAHFISPGAYILDVGSDHAYLPIALVQRGTISGAIAGEVVEGPYQSACQNVRRNKLEQEIQVRLASGLEAMTPEDRVEEIVIAGMGGRLIASILAAGKEKLVGIQTLILQPNNREAELRQWLEENHFRLVAEQILEDAGKIYEILVAKPGSMALEIEEREFGPFLMREQTTIFHKKWLKEMVKVEQLLEKIPQGHIEERELLRQRLQRMKEVLYES